MMLDVFDNFVQPSGAPQSIVGAAGATIQLGQIIDLLGAGVGVPPPSVIGNAATFGEDPGIGNWVPEVQINIGTAFATGNSAGGNFAFQYAPDTAGTYQPGTWETAAETGPKPASELTAGQILRMKVPPTPPATQRPRYARLVMTTAAGTNFTAGTVTAAFLTFGRDDLQNKQAANNYRVA